MHPLLQITAQDGLPVPKMYLSRGTASPGPTDRSFSTDVPPDFKKNPAYIPLTDLRQSTPTYERIWVSHQSPDFLPGFWYLGVHCTSPDPTLSAHCSRDYSIRLLPPQKGHYPREIVPGEAVDMLGRTKRGADPEPYSVCVEVTELGVQIRSLWKPSNNASLEAERIAYDIQFGKGDYKSPPDPVTTPFFVVSRHNRFPHASVSSEAPVFLSGLFQTLGRGPYPSQVAYQQAPVDNKTLCTQTGFASGVWYIGVFSYCLTYTPHTSFARYEGFDGAVACLPWYAPGEIDPGLAFSIRTVIVEPECPGDCESDITYMRNTGPEIHGKCLGCRGTCLCNKYWFGEGCASAECQYDNCFGHGICSSDSIDVLSGRGRHDCICDPGYSGAFCDYKMESDCPDSCYGQGYCDYGWSIETTNITVGSCSCIMEYTGHLCSYIPDKKMVSELLFHHLPPSLHHFQPSFHCIQPSIHHRSPSCWALFTLILQVAF